MKGSYKTVPATEIKNRFGDCLGEVLETHEPLFIERHGKTVAVLVEIKEWLQKGGRKTDTPWCDGLKKLLKKSANKKRGKFTPAVEMLRQIRDESSA